MTSETFQQPLLQVAQLSVSFPSPQGLIEAVNALSFDVHAGEVLALVGESGSGKSVTARTLVGLAGAGAAVRAESLILHGHDGLSQNLLACDARRWQQLRGREIGFVLQDALTSLDPLRRIGQEVAEPLLTHRLERGAAVRERVAELLTQTGITRKNVASPEPSATSLPCRFDNTMVVSGIFRWCRDISRYRHRDPHSALLFAQCACPAFGSL